MDIAVNPRLFLALVFCLSSVLVRTPSYICWLESDNETKTWLLLLPVYPVRVTWWPTGGGRTPLRCPRTQSQLRLSLISSPRS